MRKLLAFLVLLLLPWTARGQALADWYYWFDHDATPVRSGRVSDLKFQLQPDVSHLATGVHTLYVQVLDTAGVYSAPVGTMFFKVPDANGIDKMFYTIDAEQVPTVLDFGNGSFTLDVSKYQAGFHNITLQVMDKLGGVTDVMPYMFYRVPQNTGLSEFRYWFDTDETLRTMPYGQGHYILDVAHLSPGFHFVNYYVSDGVDNNTRIDNAGFFRLPVASNQQLHYWFAGDTVATHVPNYKDGFIVDVTRLQEGFNTIYFQLEDNGPSDIMTEHFVKIPQTENAGDMTLVCIIDGKIVGEEKVAAHGGVVKCEMDVSNMEVGLHKAMFQLVTASGIGSSIAETYFIRTLTNDDIASMQCSYTIDGFHHRVHKGTSSNGVFHFDLPVDEVEDGLHRIDYLLVSENGVSTTQGNAWFYKTPLGGNGIRQYDYWLNDKSDEVHSVTLDEPKDPFQLIKLLPVTTEPIRSSCFHFELKDGRPMMYAKNDIHFRFHDKSGRWVDEDKQYVDYNVPQEIKDIATLQPTQTFERPDSNCVTWFSFEAAPGDTIGFKSSQATSMQVFAPSGKEVFSASGDKSVKYNGAHTWEEGTYYVAVHDVTGSKPDITLDYFHMDRYDVVDQDVHVVGNGGCSTITFQGNGFDELESVTLVRGDANLNSIEIDHESDASTGVMFDFTDVMLGEYKAVFKFKDETKTIENCIVVEKAVDMAFDLSVSYSNQYLRSTSNTYNIKVTNRGNMTAYKFPILIYMFTPESNTLTNVKIGNYDVLGAYKELLGEHYTEHVADSIARCIQTTGDLYSFVHSMNKEYLPGYEHMYAKGITPDIGPNHTETYSVSIKANATSYVYVWCAGEWYPLSMNMEAANKVKAQASRKSGCNSIDMMNANECINRIQYGYVAHPNMHPDCDNIPPDCPHPDNGGSSTPVNSLDPNDIYGYLAESGSKFMADSILTVPYRIEFENDTTFATASAHTVIVTDTLDAAKFDLASYQPTSIKIGDKDVLLKGDKEFVTTIDMRPAINAIAQVEGMYDEKKGIATWMFTSLDPMTMEPTDDVMQGFLPVNYDGLSGIGEVAFNINRKAGLADGTEIDNRASIIFDSNDAIMTPTWTNIIDAVSPTSHVTGTEMLASDSVRIHFEGADERSGIWKYTLYAQYGEGTSWEKVADTDTTCVDFKLFDGLDYGFCVLATDSAGNVEQKELTREYGLKSYLPGDANSDGKVDMKDAILILNYYVGVPGTYLNASAADVNGDGAVDVKDAIWVADHYVHDVNEVKMLKLMMKRKRTLVL